MRNKYVNIWYIDQTAIRNKARSGWKHNFGFTFCPLEAPPCKYKNIWWRDCDHRTPIHVSWRNRGFLTFAPYVTWRRSVNKPRFLQDDLSMRSKVTSSELCTPEIRAKIVARAANACLTRWRLADGASRTNHLRRAYAGAISLQEKIHRFRCLSHWRHPSGALWHLNRYFSVIGAI
jgi:hypothetical protein